MTRRVHYGCQEVREDAELVIAERAHPELRERFLDHCASCRECRRYHQRLAAVYRKPAPTRPPDERARQREFQTILARSRELHERERLPWYGWRRTSATAGVLVLASAATLLALSLMVPSVGERLFPTPTLERVNQLALWHERELDEQGGLEHRAQSFGRVVAGSAKLIDEQGQLTSSDTFAVGARLEAEAEPVQVALLGRVLANLTPGSRVQWHSASATQLELRLLAGRIAVRYERQPDDPILLVRTPGGLVQVLDSVATISVDADERSTIAVLRGSVEVLDERGDLLALLDAGRRFDVAEGSQQWLGRVEVAAALPLADEEPIALTLDDEGETGEYARLVEQVPNSWTVPGLSEDPRLRRIDELPEANRARAELLASVNRSGVEKTAVLEPIAEKGRSASVEGTKRTRVRSRPRSESESVPTVITIDTRGKPRRPPLSPGVSDAERERKALVELALDNCRELYLDVDTRFRAARCLADFMRRHGHEPEAVEALLMFGILRMDFAQDYESATRNFEEFLRRAPDHPQAELARFNLVLAAIESGKIERALAGARAYLNHYPDGQFVGRILQRFPELKSEL